MKVGHIQPPNLSHQEVHDSFRLSGRTGEAINYPLSDAGYRWLCAFNGVAPDKAPWTFRYASNPVMRETIEARARTTLASIRETGK